MLKISNLKIGVVKALFSWLYPSLILLFLVSTIYITLFLYKNFFASVSGMKTIAELKLLVADDTVDITRFNRIKKVLADEEKKILPQLKTNPFQ